MTGQIVKSESQRGADVVRAQVNQIQYLMRDVLQEGTHYDTIKGCGTKPVLLQPGAEKIAYMFKLIPRYEVSRTELGGGHREYDITCTLTDKDGQAVGVGIGLCSTLEKKYRYRKDWHTGQQVENPDIADVYNTVLKMAKKRAFVDAVRSTTAASDIFTQDVDEESMQPQPVQPAADLGELRRLYKPWCEAMGYDTAGGMQSLLTITGAASMETMSADQVAAALSAMQQDIDDAEQQTEAAPDADAEAQVIYEEEEF